jgi:hypothetical protein
MVKLGAVIDHPFIFSLVSGKDMRNIVATRRRKRRGIAGVKPTAVI